jgi:hypothetical protein
VKNPSEAVQLAAVQQDGEAIQYIENPSEEIQLAAVQQNVLAIQWTENPKRGAKDRTDIVSIWETNHPDLTPILSLLNKEELENLKKTIPDAFLTE